MVCVTGIFFKSASCPPNSPHFNDLTTLEVTQIVVLELHFYSSYRIQAQQPNDEAQPTAKLRSGLAVGWSALFGVLRFSPVYLAHRPKWLTQHG